MPSKPKKPLSGPFDTPSPKDVWGDEVSTVTDMNGLYGKVNKIDRVLMNMAGPIGQIPEVNRKVEDAVVRVTRVETKIEANQERINRLDNKVETVSEHPCHQVEVISEIKQSGRESTQKIERDIREGIKTKANLNAVHENVIKAHEEIDKFHATRRNFNVSIIGVIMTLILTAGSAVYFIGGLGARIESSDVVTNRLERNIEKLAVKVQQSNAPVLAKVQSLSNQVEKSNGHAEEYNRICADMSRSEKTRIIASLRRSKQRIPSSCMD